MIVSMRWLRRSPRPRGWPLFNFTLITIVLNGLGASSNLVQRNLFGYIHAALFGYCVIALIFRFGWLIPCIALGTIMGIQSDLHVKSGTIESQMQETVRSIVVGSLYGFLGGIVAELLSQCAEIQSTTNLQESSSGA